MKLWIPTLLAVALVMPLAAAGDAQSGSGTTCAEFNALYNVDGLSTGESRVTVVPGTNFAMSADIGTPNVDFFGAGDVWIGWSNGALEGTVPAGAAYGVMCVGAIEGWPTAPLTVATWTYQDGL